MRTRRDQKSGVVRAALVLTAITLVLTLLLSVGMPAAARAQTGESASTTTAKTNGSTAGAASRAPFIRTIVDKGIVVELSIRHVPTAFSTLPASASPEPSGSLHQGDDVVFRLKMTDKATGNPLSGAYPAAWMDLRWTGGSSQSCSDRIQKYLGGTLFARPELDLNAYYVLALNDDASISVVDPLFGYGGSKLLSMIALKSPGEDWAITSDQSRVFVSLPESNQVAVIDTNAWQVARYVDVGRAPRRLTFQPDQEYLWVATDDGVTALAAADLTLAAAIPTGKGPHQMAVSSDGGQLFVTNQGEGTLSILDIRTLKKVGDIGIGKRPAAVSYSSLSRMAYVVDEAAGTITVIDGKRQQILTRIQQEAGLGQIKFSPGGRLGFIPNPVKNVVHILDATTNVIVQTADVEAGPDQITFSDELAYVRHRGSETVLMIPLKEVGLKGKPVPVVDFPGGQHPSGQMSRPSPADSIVQAPGANAVLVANPKDKSIYFYKEGMAAPMGNFSNYSREPRAVTVVDRSLREVAPGVYQTTAKLGAPGPYDLAFLLNTPRIVHCFDVLVEPNPELANKHERHVQVEPLVANRVGQVGEPFRLRFRLSVNESGKQQDQPLDVGVFTFLAPGTWHSRQPAKHLGSGVYEVEMVPPRPGIYYAYLECPSLALSVNNPDYVVFYAEPPGAASSGK